MRAALLGFGNSPTICAMEELRAALAAWLDPQLVGSIVLDWSGRILAALAIFVIGRIVASVADPRGSAARCSASAWIRRSRASSAA